MKAEESVSGKTGDVGRGLDKPAQEVTALPMEVFVKVTPVILLMEKYSLRGNGNSVPDSVTTWATYPIYRISESK